MGVIAKSLIGASDALGSKLLRNRNRRGEPMAAFRPLERQPSVPVVVNIQDNEALAS